MTSCDKKISCNNYWMAAVHHNISNVKFIALFIMHISDAIIYYYIILHIDHALKEGTVYCS